MNIKASGKRFLTSAGNVFQSLLTRHTRQPTHYDLRVGLIRGRFGVPCLTDPGRQRWILQSCKDRRLMVGQCGWRTWRAHEREHPNTVLFLMCSPLATQVVISGLSSPGVLTDDGIVNFARAIGL